MRLANQGSAAQLRAGTGVAGQAGEQEEFRAGSRERGRAVQAWRREKRGVTGDHSPISKQLLFSEETGKYSNFLQ